MRLDLSDKIVLLTGASGGIGQAIFTHLASAGAVVALHYFRNNKKVEELAYRENNGSVPFQADLEDEVQVEALFARVLEHYGKVDVLINNAGVFIPSSIDRADEWFRDWQRTLAINLTAPGILCREAIRHFREQNEGRVINIASRAAWRGDTPEHLDYAASKGGLIAMTKSIARGWGRDGIKAFSVAPGFVRTPMAEEEIRDNERELKEQLALSELTVPADIAPTILYLASGTMDHATGSTIDINGGSYVR